MACALAFALVGSASAETSRPLQKSIKFPDNRTPMGIAVDGAGNIYVNVRISNTSGLYGIVEKYDSEGNPVNFTAVAPYIQGNKILGRPNPDFKNEPGEEEFFTPQFDNSFPNGIAVDHSGGPNNGYFYFSPTFNDNGAMWAFKPNGEFAGLIPSVGFSCQVSVNQTNGNIYTGTSESTIKRFPPAAQFVGAVPNGTAATPNQVCGLAVDTAGNAYAINSGEPTEGPVLKYPAANFGVSPLPTPEIWSARTTSLGIDFATEHLFVGNGAEVQELTTEGEPINAPFGGLDNSHGVTGAPGDRVFVTNLGFPGGSIEVFGPPASLPVDTTEPASEVLQFSANLNGAVDPDGSGQITKCEFQWGKDSRYLEAPLPCSQATPINTAGPVSAELSGLEMLTKYHYRLVTTSAAGIQTGHDSIFETTDKVAEVVTGDPTPFDKESAVLHGSYRGQGLDTHYFFELGVDGSYGEKFPAAPADAGVENGQQEVDPVTVTGLQGETEYHYRLVMENSIGTAYGADRTFFTPAAITEIETGGVINVGNHSAELNGSFTADHLEVHYYFEWGPTTAYGNGTPALPGNALPPGSGHVDVPPVLLEGIQEGGIYHYRLVGQNSAGKTYGQDRTFKTAEPPQISNIGTKNVTVDSADLTAEVNPNRGDTEWFFEWGSTTNYDKKTPVPPGSIPAGSDPVAVGVHLDELQLGQTYHFRLVATNKFGDRESGDQAFGFYPPSCPNSLVRQETNSSLVPDCRGYELVSPGNAAGAIIEPLNAPSSGFATDPPRLAYGASYGELPDTGDALISVGDMYVATRQSTGWASKFIGKNSRETTFMAGPPHGSVRGTTNYGGNNSYFGTVTDPAIDRVVLFDLGYPAFYETIEPASNTPYVFDSTTNQKLARWPTNLSEVPGGGDFVGWQAFSEDLSHFVFSSNVSFADGGETFDSEIKCCSYDETDFAAGRCCPGPIYDNDTETGAIELVSEREDHTRFQGVPLKVSADGSHILMSETADSLIRIPRPLYMRFGGNTYDIGNSAPASYVSMTSDGSTVYFTAKAALNSEDTDTSLDLYAWHQSDPTEVTLVSKGSTGEEGNRDDCNLAWVEKCDIQIIEVSNPVVAGQSNGNLTGNQTTDTNTGTRSGDVYFVSPEQLDGARGSFGQANIYLYHEGSVRFVASAEPQACPTNFPNWFTLANCEPGKISRMQVTPNGDYAAFISKSRLTPYDNAGHAELYLYSRGENRLDCASCRPDGVAPTNETYGSQNGLFLTEDGRAFFSTDEPLLPSDTNEGNDVYEFVEGKPQLITSGVAERGSVVGFQGELTAPGLIGVSANGIDVYFATLESLVTQDHNGQAVKIYDARSNGGFPAERVKPECDAADECHGEGSAPPEVPKDRTSVPLEGNPKHSGKKKGGKKAPKHKKAKKHKRHKKAHHNKKSGHGKAGGRHAG